MKDFYKDKTALPVPWVESPFFYELLKNSDLSEDEKTLASHYHEHGYVIVDLELSDETIDGIKSDILYEIENGEATTQSDGYHYSESPRVFEAWKFSQNVLNLALNKKIRETLKLLYGKDPIPFQTINFIKGTQQPLHSDSLHFYCKPEGWMVGTWTALEDADESNGTLVYVPGSHKFPHTEFPDIGLEVPEYDQEFNNYRVYEEYVDKLVDVKNYSRQTFKAKKGQVLIWASKLLHGAVAIKDKDRTRWSQATHYYFSDCDYYYCPLYSNRLEGNYSEKNLTEKDILNHKIV